MRMTSKFRKNLEEPGIIVSVTVHNPLMGRIAEDMGFKQLDVEGSMTQFITGIPEPLANAYDYITAAKPIVDAVNIPVRVEACAGFGDASHTALTVEQYIKAGIAGCHIEDSVFPKRMGYWKRPQETYVIPTKEAISKFKAAVKARDEFDEDFVLTLRTDANVAVGGSLEEAISRANAYVDVGADMIALYPRTIEEMKIIREKVPNIPLAYLCERLIEPLSFKEAEEIGYKYGVILYAPIYYPIKAYIDMLKETKSKGQLPVAPNWTPEIRSEILRVNKMKRYAEYEREQEKEIGLPKTIWKANEK